MAVAYGTSNSATMAGTGGADALTITKPTSLATGDMMIAVCGVHGKASSGFAPPAGWTILFTADDASNYGAIAFWKIATSGDVAASNFAFTITTTSGDGLVGWIARITGSSFGGTGNFTSASDINTSATTTHTFTPGITPVSNGALYLMGSYARGLGTESGYAIANNNPSWTERVDIQINTTRDSTLSLATATATSGSASGDYNVTLSTSLEAIGFLISIQESTNLTVSPAVVSATFTVQAPTVAGGANVSPTVVSATFTVQAPTVSFPVPDFTNADKHSSTFNNQDKS